jgi:hypothetical protein
LAAAVDGAFARWDLAHLHLFTLPGGRHVTRLRSWGEEEPSDAVDSDRTRLSGLAPGAQFVYVFDLGDDWTHLCTLAAGRIDPLQQVGVIPAVPVPYFGWGQISDQYGRRWDSDDGESPVPQRPEPPLVDLPPLMPWWGPRERR